jgi:hypothetical protein
MYFEWIKRAHASGLRLLCALAVNNEYLPHLFHGGYSPKNRDPEAIGAQLAGMQRLVTEHSAWMEIALTAAHARRIVSEGKLAIVLGVEVDSIGGWRRPEDTNEAAARTLVDDLFAHGVRTMTPIHLANNALGGCACYRDAFNISNHWLNRNNPAAAHGGFWEVDAQIDTQAYAGSNSSWAATPKTAAYATSTRKSTRRTRAPTATSTARASHRSAAPSSSA